MKKYTQSLIKESQHNTIRENDKVILAAYRQRRTCAMLYKDSGANGTFKNSYNYLISAIQSVRKSLRAEPSDSFLITRKYRHFPFQEFSGRGDNRRGALLDLRTSIQRARSESRDIRVYKAESYIPRVGDYIHRNLTFDGIHLKPGTYLEAQKRIRAKRVFAAKKPTDETKHFGIELEFFANWNQSKLGVALNDAKLSEIVQLKTDGSIRARDGMHGHELNICVKESELQSTIERVCQVLTEAGADVNKSCGMHVHLDMRTKDKGLVFSNLVSSQTILYAMNPPSRKYGYTDQCGSKRHYAKPNVGKDFQTARRSGRYHGVNASAFDKFKTLEVRLHAGTVDPRKIINWVLILDAVSNLETEVARGPSTVTGFKRLYNIPETLMPYITERVEKFRSAHESRDTSTEDAAA